MASGGAWAAAFAAALLWQSGLPAAAADPSFPCTGTLAPTEAVICTDEALATLDRRLAVAYRNKFDGLPVESADALEEVVQPLVITQKAWLRHRNACGTDRVCIRRAYLTRTAALTAAEEDSPNVVCSDIVGERQAAIYVRECVAVAPETHPLRNAKNSCELILSHNIFRCTGLGDQAPKFCAAYVRPN